MLNTILLDNLALTKLTVYRDMCLLKSGEYTIHFFEKKYQFSYMKTISLLKEIAQDLLSMDDQKYIFSPKDKIIVNEELPIVGLYEQYLLKNSIVYAFIFESLTNSRCTLPEFCDAHYVSQSSVMRRIRPLVELLKKKELKINCLQMTLKGKESLIRMFYHEVIGSVTFGKDLDNFFNEREIEELFSKEDARWLNYGEQSNWRLLQQICYLRVSEGCFLEEGWGSGPNLPTINQRFRYLLERNAIAESYIHREGNFIGFIGFYRLQYTNDKDPRLVEVKKYLMRRQEQQKYFPFFWKNLKRKYMFKLLTNNEKNLWRINLQLVFLLKELFPEASLLPLNYSKDTFEETFPLVSDLRKLLVECMCVSGEDKDTLEEQQTELIELLVMASLPFYEGVQIVEPISVGLVHATAHFVYGSIERMLAKHPYVNCEIADSHSLASFDLVVSCSSDLLPDSVQEYQIINGADPYSIYQLKKKISELIHKKNQLRCIAVDK